MTLQFASFEDLWQFKKRASVTSFEVSRVNNVLTFVSTEEQMELATMIYKAIIIYKQEGEEGELE